jgi:ribosomal protein L39E
MASVRRERMPRPRLAAKMTSKGKANKPVPVWQRVQTKAAANPDQFTNVLNQPAGNEPAGFML